MKTMVTLGTFVFVISFAVAISRSAAPEERATVETEAVEIASVETATAAVALKPYRYRVEIRVRETASGDSFELTSMSLPLVKEGTPATMQLVSGDLSVTATATVKREIGAEVATVTVSLSRAKTIVASPTVQVELGRTGRVHHESAGKAIELEIVATGA